MSKQNFTKEERQQLIDAYYESERQTTWPIFDTLSSDQRKQEYAKQDQLLNTYAQYLPLVPVSRCPYCDIALEYLFDPMGLDGMWWFKDKLAEYVAPKTCEHFRVLLGGIEFHGREPSEAKRTGTVLPGPGVPFVVPSILEIPGMRAILSSAQLANSDTAYLIAYFSETPVHGAFLHQPWARQDYEVFDEDGQYEGWTVSNAEWDFNLRPWVEEGLLFWIDPDDSSLTIKKQGLCPYEDLPGVQAPQIIEQGELSVLPLPSGEVVDPFE